MSPIALALRRYAPPDQSFVLGEVGTMRNQHERHAVARRWLPAGVAVLLAAGAMLVGVGPAASAPVATPAGGATLASADAGGLGHSIAAGQNHTCALKPNG